MTRQPLRTKGFSSTDTTTPLSRDIILPSSDENNQGGSGVPEGRIPGGGSDTPTLNTSPAQIQESLLKKSPIGKITGEKITEANNSSQVELSAEGILRLKRQANMAKARSVMQSNAVKRAEDKARVITPVVKSSKKNKKVAVDKFAGLSGEVLDRAKTADWIKQKSVAMSKGRKGGVGSANSLRESKAQEGASILKPSENKVDAPTLKISLSVKQGEAFNHPAKFLLYGGAKGGGKSWFLCNWILIKALQNRGNKLFLCRRRSVDLTNTTLETWKKCVPANLYRINEQKKKIFIPASGSVIDYGGLDDPLLIQGLNSAEYAHIGVDQAEEIERDSFGMLIGTLRHKLPGGIVPDFKIRLTANPAQCWLKEYFITNPEEGTHFIPALPTDNPHLPPEYVDHLKQAFKHRPQLLSAYLHGSWDDLSGHDICIQGGWIEVAKGKEMYGAVVKRIVVNDPARFGDDENVIYVMEERANGAVIIEETVLEHKSTMDTAGRLCAIRKKHDAQLIAVDSIGIGAGIVDALYDLREPLLSINSSNKPTRESEAGKYNNLRTQMWMEAGTKFSNGRVSLPSNDFALASQLGSLKFKFTGNGKMQVEAKEDVKKRLGNSPDRADCFVMGLFALEYVNDMAHEEYMKTSDDKQGFGTKVTVDDERFVGVSEDYSGYNL